MWNDPTYQNVKIAIASTAHSEFSEQASFAGLEILEFQPKTKLIQLINRNWPESVLKQKSHLQIGRRPPLSKFKHETHLPNLKNLAGVEYSEMIFFDDCLSRDHCTLVEQNLPELCCVRCPNGFNLPAFHEGLQKWRDRQTNESKNGN